MDKETTLQSVQTEFGRLLAAVDGLDERAMSHVFYGSWGVKDILAHIAGWQHAMTRAMERMAVGERPTPEGVDYNDADSWNAKFTAAMAPQNATTIIADLKQSFANYLRAAKALPDDRFGEGKTINRILEASGYGHYREHLPAIEEYRSKIAAAA
jgi:hypothetical protein